MYKYVKVKVPSFLALWPLGYLFHIPWWYGYTQMVAYRFSFLHQQSIFAFPYFPKFSHEVVFRCQQTIVHVIFMKIVRQNFTRLSFRKQYLPRITINAVTEQQLENPLNPYQELPGPISICVSISTMCIAVFIWILAAYNWLWVPQVGVLRAARRTCAQTKTSRKQQYCRNWNDIESSPM